jgi:hypothetical protein
MRIIKSAANNLYIDQSLFDYINKIWLTYDIEIENDKTIYFAKNTTVNRLITDYDNRNITRRIKPEKADYMVIKKFNLNAYPHYYNAATNSISDSSQDEVVYGIYNHATEDRLTIETIVDIYEQAHDIKYVNQDKLNDSLNNGFILSIDNYTTVKELVDSQHPDNHKLAYNMICNSDLKHNWQWIMYIYFKQKEKLLQYDNNQKIIQNYVSSLNLGITLNDVLVSTDMALKVSSNPEIKELFLDKVKADFDRRIQEYFKILGTYSFTLNDFKIEYNG